MHIYNIKASVIPENATVGKIRRHRIKAALPGLALKKLIAREGYPLDRTHFEVFRHGLRAVSKHAPVAVITEFWSSLDSTCRWLNDLEKTEWDAK